MDQKKKIQKLLISVVTFTCRTKPAALSGANQPQLGIPRQRNATLSWATFLPRTSRSFPVVLIGASLQHRIGPFPSSCSPAPHFFNICKSFDQPELVLRVLAHFIIIIIISSFSSAQFQLQSTAFPLYLCSCQAAVQDPVERPLTL